MLSADPEASNSGSPDVSHAIKSSNMMFSKRFTEPLNVRVNTQKEINTFVNDEQKALVSELVNIMGNGDNPSVGIGKIVNVSTSVKDTGGFMLRDFGKFLVTACYHQLDGVGHYQNTFEGVAAETDKLPVKKAEKPYADMQLATVVNNNDPKNQGRIKVQFKWNCTANDDTEWLRVLSPNAGHGDTGKNRGFLVVPEVGDQVVIAFEEGNVARPVVMGSVYHSNNVEAGFSDSNTKGMISRKGSALTFDDLNHVLNIGTNAANYVKIENGGGLITAESAEIIVIKTGLSSITLKKDGTITLSGTEILVEGCTNKKLGKVTINGEETFNVISKVISETGTESINISSTGTLSQTSTGIQTIKGSQVDIN